MCGGSLGGGGANAHSPTRRWQSAHWSKAVSLFELEFNDIRNVNGVLGSRLGVMDGLGALGVGVIGGSCDVPDLGVAGTTDEAREADGVPKVEPARENEVRREGSGGTASTRLQPKREVRMAVSEGSVEGAGWDSMKTSAFSSRVSVCGS